VVAAYGSGHMRVFAMGDGAILAEANAHAGS